MVSTTESVQSIEDVKTREVIVGATAPEQDPAMFPRLLNDLLGTKFKIVYGYGGQPDTFLAIERGELDGLFMSGWSGPGRAYVREKMKEGKMRLLVQMSATGDPAHSDTPTVLSLIKNDNDRQVVELLLSRLALGRPFLSPPGIPADRVAMLRDAFRKAATDPALREEAVRLRLAIDPIFGEEAQALIAKIYTSPPQLVVTRPQHREDLGPEIGERAHHGRAVRSIEAGVPSMAEPSAEHKFVCDFVDRNEKAIALLGDSIFYFGELGMQEFETSKLMADLLEQGGFAVERGIADMPTAFCATYGADGPVIAMHTEYDSVPNNSQAAGKLEATPITEGAPGHCEGHNVNAAVLVSGALAAARAIDRFGLKGG